MGRIGLALSPADPDVLYAIVEAQGKEGGVLPLDDSGASWEKRGDYVSGSPQYYNELVADPHDVDRVYSMDTWMHVTEDGGKTWTKVPEKYKHVDNHALWIDPDDTDHLIVGCDGGVYETWDRGARPGTSSPTCRSHSSTRPRRTTTPVLQRLRRHAGQRDAGRAVAHDQRSRHRQPRLVRHDLRRRLQDPRRAGQPGHRLFAVPVRRPGALRPQERRADRHPAAAGARRGSAALQLGLGADHQPALATRLYFAASASSAATTAATAGCRSAPT